jgi:hypothetical protein
MAEKRNLVARSDQSGQGVVLLPAPQIRLNDLEAVRREMARVYREARGGMINSQDASRFVYILGELRKLFEATDLERRIKTLESSDGI